MRGEVRKCMERERGNMDIEGRGEKRKNVGMKMKEELWSQKGRERGNTYIKKIGTGRREKICTQREGWERVLGLDGGVTRKECTEQNVNKFLGSCNVL